MKFVNKTQNKIWKKNTQNEEKYNKTNQNRPEEMKCYSCTPNNICVHQSENPLHLFMF